MSLKEVICKFVSFELMIKDSKHIVNLEQGATSTPEVQPIAFKALEENKEESTPSRLPIDASKFNNEEMALIIKSFQQILKQRKGKDYKPRSKRVCYRCGKFFHFIDKCPYTSDSDMDDDKKGKKKMEKKDITTRRRVARRMWGGNGTPTRAPPTPPPMRTPPTSPLIKAFSSPTWATNAPWLRTTRRRRYTPKYTTFDDEGSSSDDNDDLTCLFANLTKDQKK
jgi:hypothetical protein